MRRRPWSVEPLVALIAWEYPGEDPRRLLNISGDSWRRALDEGISDRNADEWAIRMGYHPCEVWGPAWWTMPDVAVDVEETAAA